MDGTLIRDPAALCHALRRLHASNDGVVFWNHQRTFKLMLRNDPCDSDDALACELLMVFDDDDAAMTAMMELGGDAYMEEPGSYVLEQWGFKLDALDARAVEKVAAALNRAYLTRVCPCGKYLVRDDGGHCVFCQMTSTPEDRTKHFCSICCDGGLRMHMDLLPCCQQYLHRHCLATWRRKSGDTRCPLCRQ
jgi:hypothetical protein